MSAFEKGHEKKGGRRPGAPNKPVVSDIARMALKDIIEQYMLSSDVKGLKYDISMLRPADRSVTLEKWAKYVMPTLNAIKVEGMTDGEPVNIIVSYKDKPIQKDDDDANEGDYSIKI